jgi:hypothetical protein
MNTRALVESVDLGADRSLLTVSAQPRTKPSLLATAAISIGVLLTVVWIAFLVWLPGYALGLW